MSFNLKTKNIENFEFNKYKLDIWKVQLDLLNKFKDFCKINQLKWFVIAGTLLGAVRHKGFIPWDDDLDVAMPRKDFDVFIEKASINFKFPYFVQTAKTDKNYFISIARLRNSTTTGIINSMSKNVYNNGIFIDIYVYDNIPSSKVKLEVIIFKTRLLAFFLNNYSNNNSRNLFYFFLFPFLILIKLFFTYEELLDLHHKVITKYHEKTQLLGFLCMPRFIRYYANEKDIEILKVIEFENTTVFIPSGYHFILTNSYGDYMIPPPINVRGKWHNGIITYNPYISYLEYYKLHPENYKEVLCKYYKKK